MHFVFIPYGNRNDVERLLRDMESQKHKLMMYKNLDEAFAWINGQIRILPFGIHEYVFPKDQRDAVLNTLLPEENRYNISWIKLEILRKLFKVKKLPKFKRDYKFLWITQNVNIIPIGIREDADMIEPKGEYKDWVHEAI